MVRIFHELQMSPFTHASLKINLNVLWTSALFRYSRQ